MRLSRLSKIGALTLMMRIMANALNASELMEEDVFTSEELAKRMKLYPSTIRKIFVEFQPSSHAFSHACEWPP